MRRDLSEIRDSLLASSPTQWPEILEQIEAELAKTKQFASLREFLAPPPSTSGLGMSVDTADATLNSIKRLYPDKVAEYQAKLGCVPLGADEPAPTITHVERALYALSQEDRTATLVWLADRLNFKLRRKAEPRPKKPPPPPHSPYAKALEGRQIRIDNIWATVSTKDSDGKVFGHFGACSLERVPMPEAVFLGAHELAEPAELPSGLLLRRKLPRAVDWMASCPLALGVALLTDGIWFERLCNLNGFAKFKPVSLDECVEFAAAFIALRDAPDAAFFISTWRQRSNFLYFKAEGFPGQPNQIRVFYPKNRI